MSGEIRKQIRIFGLLFMVLAVSMLVLCIRVAGFNNMERELYYSDAGAEEENINKQCAVTIKPRGGSTDTWIKRVEKKNKNGTTQELQYAGCIYDIMIVNQTDVMVTDWMLKVLVSQDGFLNNAWCGTLEIHQYNDTGELVQTLDLRKCIEQKEEILLEHEIAGGDLMIPVKQGDYFIYHPSVADKEDIIEKSNPDTGEYKDKRVDFIAYHEIKNGNMPEVDFQNAVLVYRLHKDITKLPAFYILLGLFGIWCVCVVVMIIVHAKTRRLLERTRRDAEIIEQSMSAFMGFIDAKDSTTNGHSMRVAQYARKLAWKLGFSQEECDRVYYIGLMHDCGKIGIPDAILNKPDKLTAEEYEIIKTHTIQGKRILENFSSIEGIREGALYHHERYDGNGYPEGLKGEEIPLIARIICVADSFDVMNSERCYQRKMTKEDIIEQLKSNKGKQFDPSLIDSFLDLLADKIIEF